MGNQRFHDNLRPVPKEWPALKKIWLKALRSGEYKQGKGQLCTKDNKFCCLGVFIDTCVDTEWVEDGDDSQTFGWGIREKDHAGSYVETSLLPEHVANQYMLGDVMDDLALMNDGSNSLGKPGDEYYVPGKRKKSFSQIADWIEKNL